MNYEKERDWLVRVQAVTTKEDVVRQTHFMKGIIKGMSGECSTVYIGRTCKMPPRYMYVCQTIHCGKR